MNTGIAVFKGCKNYKSLVTIVSIFVIMVAILSTAVVPAFAVTPHERVKLYKSVEIAAGDSLWSIAGDYGCPEYSDSSRFIREVMEINHLTDADSIHEGAYLVIPYYADVDKEA